MRIIQPATATPEFSRGLLKVTFRPAATQDRRRCVFHAWFPGDRESDWQQALAKTMDKSPLRTSGRRLILVSFGVVVVACAAIWLNLDAARLVSTRADRLVSEFVPELRDIGVLQAATNQRVIELYRYYATTDVDRWEDNEPLRLQSAGLLQGLNTTIASRDSAADLIKAIADFERAVSAFHEEMSKSASRDWDKLRAHLAIAQEHATRIDHALTLWSSAIRASVEQGGLTTMFEISRLQRFQFGFSVGVSVVVLLVIAMLYTRTRDQAKLYRGAYYDRLTGLPNRRRMEQDWAERSHDAGLGEKRALLLVSLERFQMVTGTFGYGIGDRLVSAISEQLVDTVSHKGTNSAVYHLAPAVWLIVVDDDEEHESASETALEVLDLAARPLYLDERKLVNSFSIGMTYFPEHSRPLDALLRNADISLRVAQADGGNRAVVYHQDMKERAENWLATETALRQALEENEFELFYQPKLTASDLSCAGAEALVRWRRDGRLVSPAEFIPVAEESGLIVPIGEWVLNEALRQWQQWHAAGLPARPIAVNVSAQQFSTSTFVDVVECAIEAFSIPPEMIELEITEQAAVAEDIEGVIETMNALRKLGVALAIDDFGTGYSSLSYLKRFPLNVLKIDRSFVSQMEVSRRDRAIVHMILILARELECRVVAEGVETEGQERDLIELGCDLLQGFRYSQPLCAEEYAAFLSDHTTSWSGPHRDAMAANSRVA